MLTSVYVLFWMLWGTHHFFAPEHHHEKKVCRSAPNEKHIHGEEYSNEACPVCHFLPTTAETLQIEWSLTAQDSTFIRQNFGPASVFFISALASTHPRGPPVRNA